MPGNGNYNGDPFRLGQAPTARKNFFAEQQQQGCKRKYSDEDFNLAGPSTSTGVGDILFSGKRHCSVFNDTMQPSTSMDCDDDAPAMMEEPSILPSTLYSHMVPYAGTPPAPHRNTSRPEFPRAAALAPFYGNLSPAEVARYQNSASTSQDHCRCFYQLP
ncbi:hypothetical protein BV898_15592 [Hypsibius exemplaris]|uniref:Uncharacterized protein n=1 Tax=Hypsibius exemplaris TaxID=2072580 RepID=A0A9X6RKD8_HYPEX|nr:hypothetical protein BV898_15592 [Hypsibius exemplaris]